MRLIDADAFDERIRTALGVTEEELSDDFKDGVLTVLRMLKGQPTIEPERNCEDCRFTFCKKLPKEDEE